MEKKYITKLKLVSPIYSESSLQIMRCPDVLVKNYMANKMSVGHNF